MTSVKPNQTSTSTRQRQEAKTPPTTARRMHAGMAGKGKRCLLPVWSVVLARSFRSFVFFLSLPPLHSHHPPPPGRAGEGSQFRGRERKGNYLQQQKGPLSLPTDPDHHPVGAPESKRTGQGQQGQLGQCGGGTQGDRRGSGLAGPQKKILGANVGQSTYIHIRPAQPNPIQAVPRSFLSTSTFPVELELVLELAPHLTESEE